MKPECYGSFTPISRTPCAQCAQRGPCSAATFSEGFRIMPHPRYARESVRLEKAIIAPSAGTQDTMNRIIARMEEAGYRTSVRAVKCGKHVLMRVKAGLGNRIRLEFPVVSPRRMSDIRAACRGEIRPLMLKMARGAKTKCTPRMLRAARDKVLAHSVGCVVVCSAEEDAVHIALEVAKRIFGVQRG